MRTKDPKCEDLRQMELFRGCTDKELARVAGVLTEVAIPAGDVLTREGRFEREQCFLIMEGEVAVSRGGRELAMLGPGALVGEAATIARGPRSATVVAIGPLRTMVFDPSTFLALLDTMPCVRKSVLRTLASRLRTADAAVPAAR